MSSSKELCGNKGVFEYFIEYISSVSIISLYIKLPQMYAFVKYFDIFSSWFEKNIKKIQCSVG